MGSIGGVNALRDSFALFQRDFALAVRRYTALPTPAAAPSEEPRAPHALLLHLPGIGWLAGLVACLVFAVVSLVLLANPWSATVAAVATTLATVLLTGGLHERALHQAAENLAPAGSGAGGSSGGGTLALVLVLAAKLALLAALAAASEAAVMAALFAAHVISRFVPVAIAHWTSPADVDGRALRTASLWTLVPLVLLAAAGGPALLLAPLLVAALAVYALLRFLRRRGAAFDDRVAGAVQQVCEVAFYLGTLIGGGA